MRKPSIVSCVKKHFRRRRRISLACKPEVKKLCRAVCFFVPVLLCLWAFTSLFFLPFPELDAFMHGDWSTRIYDRHGVTVQILALENGIRREFIPLSEIPAEAVDIFIAAEDRHFFSHCGIDFSAVLRAAVQNIQNRRRISGASTLTMQLARLVVPAAKRSFATKIREAWNALRIERRLGKKQILEFYLNTLPFGFQTEGLASAARTFFARPLNSLSREQLCCLAVIPRRPALYNPFERPQLCAEKAYRLYCTVFENAAAVNINDIGMQTDKNAQTFQRFVDAAENAQRFEYPFYLPHYVDYLKKHFAGSALPPEVHIHADALLSLQTENLLQEELKRSVHARVYNGAVFAIENKTGNVIVWVGSNSYFDGEHQGQIDGVTALNQSGSSMKPFLYALALEKGFKPSDVLPDIPMRFGAEQVYIPRNFNNRYNGPVRLRTALASSLNVPAVSLLDSIGEAAYVQILDNLHFASIRSKGFDAGLALALGSAPVSLYELVRAFSVFPRDGMIVPLRHFRHDIPTNVRPQNENVDDAFVAHSVYTPDTARLICSILSDSDARVKGFGFSSVFKTNFPSIFKTGTANQHQSLVALCASSAYTVGVWLGNFSGETVIGKTGSSIPAYIAKEVLTHLHCVADSDGELFAACDFAHPEHWHIGTICALSGMKASPDCPNTISEYLPDFLLQADEKQSCCTWHKKENGRLLTVYPEEYREWFLSVERHGIVDRSADVLTVVRPVSGSRFIYENTAGIGIVPLEVRGGSGENAQVFYDGREYAVLERPFFAKLPVERGTHSLRIVCGNEETSVFFTVE